VWIKGHAGNAENEVCDKLAVEASQKKDLLDDTGFESGDDENELFNN
jgi:ribonuclease HI